VSLGYPVRFQNMHLDRRNTSLHREGLPSAYVRGTHWVLKLLKGPIVQKFSMRPLWIEPFELGL
jgi:hypothetical protein